MSDLICSIALQATTTQDDIDRNGFVWAVLIVCAVVALHILTQVIGWIIDTAKTLWAQFDGREPDDR